VPVSEEPAIYGPLTVSLSEICKGPRCGKKVTGKATYCGQECRNDAHALRRVAGLFADMPDHQVLKILEAWRPRPRTK
jgi:hypothetical protein